MSKVFSAPGSIYLKADEEDCPLVADIVLNGAGSGAGASSTSLPLIAITDLSDRGRFQLDCTLDGALHLFAAAGGLTTCQLTFMDRISTCGHASLGSPVSVYQAVKENPGKTTIRVNIYGADGESALATVTGVVVSCTVKTSTAQGLDVMLVTYTIVGAMSKK